MPPDERYKVSVRRGGKRVTAIKPERISQITEDIAYWRKANQIHQWFVDNVQEGVDDCKEYHVSPDQLRELLDTVNAALQGSRLVAGKITNGYTLTATDGQVVKNPIVEDGQRIADPSVAQALLPTQEGFFFGSTDYDEGYYDDLEYTRDVLTNALAEKDDGWFYYESSW
ncbi:MAG: hypothetical protein ACXW4P_03780 [Thermoanaerobaculia bacterium]